MRYGIRDLDAEGKDEATVGRSKATRHIAEKYRVTMKSLSTSYPHE